MAILIESLYLYPVKSCAPVPVTRFACTEKGPEWDREWMIVNPEGTFVTQREMPSLALIQPELLLQEAQLHLSHPSSPRPFALSLDQGGETREVVIHGQATPGVDQGAAVADWLSTRMGQPLRLVRCPPAGRPRTSDDPRTIRFADSYPLHLCSTASLADLSARVGSSLEMLRFRPNIVVSGVDAWAEDVWPAFQAGGNRFRNGKRCERCPITTVDPARGERTGAEPLKTLAAFRRNARNKVEFGQYFHAVAGATLEVGMELRPG